VGWLDLNYNLSAFANRDVTVTIEAQPTGWYFEYVFIDTIASTNG